MGSLGFPKSSSSFPIIQLFATPGQGLAWKNTQWLLHEKRWILCTALMLPLGQMLIHQSPRPGIKNSSADSGYSWFIDPCLLCSQNPPLSMRSCLTKVTRPLTRTGHSLRPGEAGGGSQCAHRSHTPSQTPTFGRPPSPSLPSGSAF